MTSVIAVYFLGGTISMTASSVGARASGAVARLDGPALIASVSQLADLDVRLDVHDSQSVPSAALTFDDIAAVVAAANLSDADGVVVVQGTDTIEESAYLIDLLWDLDTPIVVTGAMRTATTAGADGPANLLTAVTVAASSEFRGMGALVAFADQVHAARWVRKTHTTSVTAFASPNTGPVGMLVEGVAVRLTSLTRQVGFAPSGPLRARVPVLAVGMDDGGELLPDAAQCDGLVVAGLGAGHVPPALAEPLGALAQRIPVVLTSRTGAGPVLSRTYGAAGSETDLLARGLIRAGLLDPYKARTLLRVAVACDLDADAIAAEFARR